MSPLDPMGMGAGMTSTGALTVRATGVHLVFTQPVSAPGVPAQYVEHILGEVFVDSLAAPAPPVPSLDLSLSGSSSLSPSSSCPGGRTRGASSGASASGSGSSGGGSTSSGSLTPAASGSISQGTTSGSTGTSLPAAFAMALRKPLWLLLAYLVWQTLVVGTGWSLWNWRREEAS
jgi:hypothetical protein